MCALGVLDDLFELDALTKLGGPGAGRGLPGLQRRAVLLHLAAGQRRADASTSPRRRWRRCSSSWPRSTRSTSSTGSTGWRPGSSGSAPSASSSSPTGSRPSTGSRWRSPRRCSARRWPARALGFVSHNFHPAAMFMGDSGSMLIGMVLAGSALTLTGELPGGGPRASGDAAPGQPAAGAAADPAADLDPHRAVRRPAAGRRPPHPARGSRRSPRTSSTCTTGCSSTATPTAGRSS